MKKKIDVITVVSIVFIILCWLGIFLAPMSRSTCAFDDLARLPRNIEQLFGGIVYANNILPQINKISPLDSWFGTLLGILQFLPYLWCVFLIAYPIIKFIRLKTSREDFVNQDDYEMKKKELKYIGIRNVILAVLLSGSASLLGTIQNLVAKPVIYIYPETETKVQVSVGYPEKLSCVYPEYDTEEGWEVIAKPNGDLIDTRTGRNLYCLYWEGNQKQEYKFKDGFLVAGKDSAKFLEEKLTILGLNEREANEFIIYWLPKLEANKYNLIRFETMEEIEEYMPLNIEPKPDTVIRIVMDFKGLNRPIEIEEQKLERVVREGYTVVEWGGSEF